MMESGGFYQHLQEVPNPDPEGTKGTLEKFNHNAGVMAGEALRRTGAEMVEYDARPNDEMRIAEIETNVDGERQGENI